MVLSLGHWIGQCSQLLIFGLLLLAWPLQHFEAESLEHFMEFAAFYH
jgi:hypothetical protein